MKILVTVILMDASVDLRDRKTDDLRMEFSAMGFELLSLTHAGAFNSTVISFSKREFAGVPE